MRSLTPHPVTHPVGPSTARSLPLKPPSSRRQQPFTRAPGRPCPTPHTITHLHAEDFGGGAVDGERDVVCGHRQRDQAGADAGEGQVEVVIQPRRVGPAVPKLLRRDAAAVPPDEVQRGEACGASGSRREGQAAEKRGGECAWCALPAASCGKPPSLCQHRLASSPSRRHIQPRALPPLTRRHTGHVGLVDVVRLVLEAAAPRHFAAVGLAVAEAAAGRRAVRGSGQHSAVQGARAQTSLQQLPDSNTAA